MPQVQQQFNLLAKTDDINTDINMNLTLEEDKCFSVLIIYSKDSALNAYKLHQAGKWDEDIFNWPRCTARNRVMFSYACTNNYILGYYHIEKHGRFCAISHQTIVSCSHIPEEKVCQHKEAQNYLYNFSKPRCQIGSGAAGRNNAYFFIRKSGSFILFSPICFKAVARAPTAPNLTSLKVEVTV